MKIAITGSTGFIGTALTTRLRESGHSVVPIVRTATNAEHILWNPAEGTIDTVALEEHELDAVIHLAGVGIAEKKWSDAQKEAILTSRTTSTDLLAQTLSRLVNKPSHLISASAIGYYGDKGITPVNEKTSPGNDFLSNVCQQWEASAHSVKDSGIALTTIRTGIVLDSHGGTLAQMITPFKLGLGGRIGSGKQYMSWISLPDHLSAVEFILANKITGPVNLTAPEPVTNTEFTKALGERLSRPTLLPTPLLPLKLKFGSELIESLMLASARVEPRVLLDAGFVFKHPTLREALNEVV